jgi:hypothetical protein
VLPIWWRHPVPFVRKRGHLHLCPPNKGGSEADALGRRKGSLKLNKVQNNPRWPANKDHLKEPRDGVLVNKLAPIPSKGKEPLRLKDKKSSGYTEPKRPTKPLPSRWVNRKLELLINDGRPLLRGRLRPKKPKTKVIFQKWNLDNESWNLKRSPRLKRLRWSLAKVVKGENPFYKFKDLLKKVKVRSLGAYNRYKSILDGGFLVGARSIGIRVTPQIRKVVSLSFREMEILISKLPYWATSYESCDI